MIQVEAEKQNGTPALFPCLFGSSIKIPGQGDARQGEQGAQDSHAEKEAGRGLQVHNRSRHGGKKIRQPPFVDPDGQVQEPVDQGQGGQGDEDHLHESRDGMDLRSLSAVRPFQECNKEHAKGVKGGQEGGGHAQGPEDLVDRPAMDECGKKDAVLAEIPSQGGEGTEAERPYEHEPEDAGQMPAQAAHPEDVVFLGKGLDHTAGPKEQEGLKKGMGQQMKHAPYDVSGAHGKEHVPDLADGRIGQNPFDVALGQSAQGGIQGR